MTYIDLSFYERNIDSIITFPSFISCSSKEYIAECFCGRKDDLNYPGYFCPYKERKKNGIFSVLYKIDYKYEDNWVPSAFSVYNLSQNKEECEYIFPPFSFYRVKNIEIDFNNYEASINLENIGKELIFEEIIKTNKTIIFNEKENIMTESRESEYPEEINKILIKQYPYLSLSTSLLYQDNEELRNTDFYESQI